MFVYTVCVYVLFCLSYQQPVGQGSGWSQQRRWWGLQDRWPRPDTAGTHYSPDHRTSISVLWTQSQEWCVKHRPVKQIHTKHTQKESVHFTNTAAFTVSVHANTQTSCHINYRKMCACVEVCVCPQESCLVMFRMQLKELYTVTETDKTRLASPWEHSAAQDKAWEIHLN